MKTILFLTNMNPFPGCSGGTIKTRKLVDGLIEAGYCIYLCYLDVNSEDNSESWRQLYKNKNISIFRVYNGQNIRSLRNLISSIFWRIPLNVYRNRSRPFFSLVRELLNEYEIDIILVDHLEMIQYVPQDWQKKTIFHEHNAEYIIWERYARLQRNIILKYMVKFEAYRIKKYEKKACDFALKVLAAPDDITFLANNYNINKFYITYHMGDDSLLDSPKLEKPKEFNILFIGTLTWKANLEGIKWFLHEVYPFIIEAYPSANLWIVGKNKKEDIIDLHNEHTHFLGFVDDLEVYMQNSTVFICPILFGSGMKLKILEAMYRGIPFVTTSIGAESIITIDEQNTYKYPFAGCVTDDACEFANAIIDIYENDEKWECMSKTARLIAKKEYRWEDEIYRFSKVIELV